MYNHLCIGITSQELCTQVLIDFTHILQGYFTGTGEIMWLPQYQWRNPEGYGYIYSITWNHDNRWYNHNKTKFNKIVCIFYIIIHKESWWFQPATTLIAYVISALLALCEVIHWWPVVSPHKGPVMQSISMSWRLPVVPPIAWHLLNQNVNHLLKSTKDIRIYAGLDISHCPMVWGK